MKKLFTVVSLLTLAACARNGSTNHRNLDEPVVVANQVDLDAGPHVAASDNELVATLAPGSYFQLGEDYTFSDKQLSKDVTSTKPSDFSFWRIIKVDGKIYYGSNGDEVISDVDGSTAHLTELVAKKKDQLYISWFTPKMVKGSGPNDYIVKADQKYALHLAKHSTNDEVRFHLDEACYASHTCLHGLSILEIDGQDALKITVKQFKALLGSEVVVMEPQASAPTTTLAATHK